MRNALAAPGVYGDGLHDDTAGLQAALDAGPGTVHLPQPPAHYVVTRPLRLHSYQSLVADRYAVIRLADHAHAYLLTNADHAAGNEHLAVTGGIWDGNNLAQTCAYHQPGGTWRVPFDPARYLGVIMQFNRVRDLHVSGLTLKDPETFGFQGGNLERFTVADITFDYNLRRGNMDGIHVHGNSHHGRIVNLKGTTNDDLVALNADDGEMFELSRGPITDVLVDGVWSQDGYTAVRLLSAGSPIQRVKLANLFGTYRYNVVSFTNHRVHPGTASTFDDIVIDGVFCAKAAAGQPATAGAPVSSHLAPIWIDAPAVVSHLTIRDYHRTETAVAADDIVIETGATVAALTLSDVALANRCGAPLSLLHNRGTIGTLALQHVHATAAGAAAGATLVRNAGTISRLSQWHVRAEGFAPDATTGAP